MVYVMLANCTATGVVSVSVVIVAPVVPERTIGWLLEALLAMVRAWNVLLVPRFIVLVPVAAADAVIDPV